MKKYNNYNNLTNDKDIKFDFFLNKTIILNSKKFFKKEVSINHNENISIDKENFSTIFHEFIKFEDSGFDNINIKLELNNALKKLSAIEQAVIFLLYNQELSQEDASKILDICSKSVSRIKIRAISKLRKYMNGDGQNEK